MLDPRHQSKEPITPPAPLPFVSRKALKRVKQPLPVPKSCRYCRGAVQLVHNREVYGREYGEWPFLYHCCRCDAYVGLHPHTDIPLGTLANRPLREARKRNKAIFFSMFEAGIVNSRNVAYQWLAKKMRISVEECHWGWFNEGQCNLAGQLCRDAIKSGELTP